MIKLKTIEININYLRGLICVIKTNKLQELECI